MQPLHASDPLLWLLLSYLLGTLACGAWALLVHTLRSSSRPRPSTGVALPAALPAGYRAGCSSHGTGERFEYRT